MDDELLMNEQQVDTFADELGDALNDYMMETPAHPTGDAAAETTNAGAAEVPTLADGRPVTALTKKQAKAELDKKEYKAWKKAMKSIGASADSDDEADGEAEKKKEKKEKKDKSDKKEKKDKSKKDKKKSSSKRTRGGDGSDSDAGDDFAAELEGLAGDAEGLENAKRRRREKVKAGRVRLDDGADGENNGYAAAAGSSSIRRTTASSSAAANANAKRMSKEERDRVGYANAQALVSKMAAARKHDAAVILKKVKGSLPIQRIMIKEEVLDFARKKDNEVPLVKAGFLREIAHWILDGASNELAPLDLRNIAYELLLTYGFKGSMEATNPNYVADREDFSAWTGIGKEELEVTSLGKAVNFSRQHSSETSQNRMRAVTLLQRLSRAFSYVEDGDSDDEGGARGRKGKKNAGPLAVRWSCEHDEEILAPFEYVTNATEVFQNKIIQVDPLDPESYLRVPPLRIRKTPIR